MDPKVLEDMRAKYGSTPGAAPDVAPVALTEPAAQPQVSEIEAEMRRRYFRKEAAKGQGRPTIEPARGDEIPIEGEQESFIRRAKAGVNISPEGMLKSIRKMGYHAKMNDDNSIRYYDSEAKKWRMWDGQGFNVNDIADASGEIGEALASGAAGAAFGPPGAVIGAMGANAARQAGSDDPYSPMERVGSVVGSGALAYAGDKAVDLIGAGRRALGPKRILAKHLDRQAMEPEGLLGQQVEEVTGLGFTPAQRAASPAVADVEAVAAGNTLQKTRGNRLYERQLQDGLDKLEREVALSQGAPTVVGGTLKYNNSRDSLWEVSNTVKDLTRKIKDRRRESWQLLTKQAQEATGNAAVVDAAPFVARLREIVEDNVGVGLEGSAALVAKRATGIINSIEKNGGRLTLRDWNNHMAHYRRIAEGKGTFTSQAQAGTETGLGKRLTESLNATMDGFIKNNVDGEAGTLMRAAREQWGDHSQQLTELLDTRFAKALGFNAKGGKLSDMWNDPQAMVKAMGGLSNDQIKAATSALSEIDPSIGQRMKGVLFEDALRKGGLVSNPDLPEVAVGQINPTKLNKALRDSPVWGILDPKERRMFSMMTVYFDRIAGNGLERGAKNSIWDQARRVMSMASGYPDPGLIKEVATGYFASGKIMTLMEDSVARRHAFKVAHDMGSKGEFTNRTLKSLMYLVGSAGFAGNAEQGQDPELANPQPQQQPQ